jgi:hypothetical protein
MLVEARANVTREQERHIWILLCHSTLDRQPNHRLIVNQELQAASGSRALALGAIFTAEIHG